MATARTVAERAKELPLHLSLEQYVPWAQQRNNAVYRPPSRHDKYRSPMWEFVRLLAAHPDLKGLTAKGALKKLDVSCDWEDLFPLSEDPVIEFVTTWDKVRVAAGDDILMMAVGNAQRQPLRLCVKLSPGYCQLVSIAFHLQRLRPGDYIMLPVERLAPILHVSSVMVGQYIQQATKAEYLERLQKHHFPSHQAAKYTFDLARFDGTTLQELAAEKRSHFDKECKEFEESQDFKESHDLEMTNRINEESERKERTSGLGNDVKRIGGNPRVGGVPKISDSKQYLKEQAAFLQTRDDSGHNGNSNHT